MKELWRVKAERGYEIQATNLEGGFNMGGGRWSGKGIARKERVVGEFGGGRLRIFLYLWLAIFFVTRQALRRPQGITKNSIVFRDGLVLTFPLS
jgi:hypothetical protein